MVKVTAPLFSLDASGSLAGALVYSKWKGRNYVRQLVKPSNPRSGGQTGMRAVFKFLTQIWDGLSDANKATWESRAEDAIISTFNAFVSYNLDRTRNYEAPGKQDPALDTGTPSAITNETATAGERSITLSGDTGVGAEQWGVAIFRSPTSSFTLAWDNMIAAIEVPASDSFAYVDSPLEPATWYYNFKSFTDEGLWGTDETEVSDTVT